MPARTVRAIFANTPEHSRRADPVRAPLDALASVNDADVGKTLDGAIKSKGFADARVANVRTSAMPGTLIADPTIPGGVAILQSAVGTNVDETPAGAYENTGFVDTTFSREKCGTVAAATCSCTTPHNGVDETPTHDPVSRGFVDSAAAALVAQWAVHVVEGVVAAINAGVFLPTDPGSWICSAKFCGFFVSRV